MGHLGSPGKMKKVILPCPRTAAAAMHFFWKPYKSEVGQFIDELRIHKPTLEAEQRAGRALLWDRAPDRSAQAEWRQARVAQQPYVYQSKTGS
jgi:hypothetical protein